ncbi:hypothetical protein LTR08_009226 [Meristemomyces frigidus]|nr:hypothetical protein LTR08_009226 [Meristemomyces frigidus]
MLALGVTFVAATLLIPLVAAQEDYIIWASVIYSRTGERTPEVLGFIPTTLTSLGAQQAYNSGSFFRDRYLNTPTIIDGVTSAPLEGLSANTIDVLQLYVSALDLQHSTGSAQAFVQGLYPPFTLNSSAWASQLDPTSQLGNGSYVEYPLQGYQYPQIHTASALDSEFPYLGGSLDCPAFDVMAGAQTASPEFSAQRVRASETYQDVGKALLTEVLDPVQWDYYNAYAIYDYLNYQNVHNMSTQRWLLGSAQTGLLSNLQWYADQQQYAQLGNLSAENRYSPVGREWPSGVKGSISTIAGNMLAYKILAQLQQAIETSGEYYKLSLLFGDFEPLLSFFALNGLPNIDSNFYGLPSFGSAAVFELFSVAPSASIDGLFPSADDLRVRFYFRNGTDGNATTGGDLQAYPLFDRGPNLTDMTWDEFQAGMYNIALLGAGAWCSQCAASNVFCGAWNSSIALSSGDDYNKSSHRSLSPAIAGVIGAIVTLAIAALLFAGAMVVGGLRVHRRQPNRKSNLGGFKGSQKLASDTDLTAPKGGAVVGATVERSPDSPVSAIGRERVGSWELRQKETDRPNIAIAQSEHRLSFESERPVNPFDNPVKADERV